ncbi:hypothetical protein AB834_00050 [PVC group bacterium (ex Bugula neritina AB1)]|nr:hypothetical protein AB834_00050 [PVC group bacterium (ex Bugula neritina AB1)]
MVARDYQTDCIEKTLKVLENKKDTIIVSATGSGKTVMFCQILKKMFVEEKIKKALVISHKKEIHSQNFQKFKTLNPEFKTSLVDSTSKNFSGQVVFGMIQTLNIHKNLLDSFVFDLVVIDEAHHSVCASFKNILSLLRESNPSCKLLGVTATPNRNDKVGLSSVFSNISHEIGIGELTKKEILTPSRYRVIDLDASKNLSNLEEMPFKKCAFVPTLKEVVRVWQEEARERQTIVFCSSIKQAFEALDEFRRQKIPSAVITGTTKKNERDRIFEAYSSRKIRVFLNVNVASEGWDSPITSCVVILKFFSCKPAFVQMVGRGLRRYEGKEDCLVLDFGTSFEKHGTLEEEADLDPFMNPKKEEEDNLEISSLSSENSEFEKLKLFLTKIKMKTLLLDENSPANLFKNNRFYFFQGYNGSIIGILDDDKTYSVFCLKRHQELELLEKGLLDRESLNVAMFNFFEELEGKKMHANSYSWWGEKATANQKKALRSLSGKSKRGLKKLTASGILTIRKEGLL